MKTLMLKTSWYNEWNLFLRNLLSFKFRKDLPRVEFCEQECAFYASLLSVSQNWSANGQIQQVVDIGCKNWSYLESLIQAFPEAQFLGIEVDPYQRYLSGYRRKDFALAYAKVGERISGKPCSILFGDFRTLSFELPTRTLFCSFFPFVSDRPCLQWGLPKRFNDFEGILEKALQFSDPLFLTAHQGEWEAEEARKAYQNLNIAFLETRFERQGSYATHVFYSAERKI